MGLAGTAHDYSCQDSRGHRMSTQGTSDTSDGDLTPTAQLRRGDRAIGTDGDLGAVEQLVVDQDTGEQRGIVVRRASDNAEFEIPVDRVQRLGDGEVYLNVARADLGTRPDVARPYDPGQY